MQLEECVDVAAARHMQEHKPPPEPTMQDRERALVPVGPAVDLPIPISPVLKSSFEQGLVVVGL